MQFITVLSSSALCLRKCRWRVLSIIQYHSLLDRGAKDAGLPAAVCLGVHGPTNHLCAAGPMAVIYQTFTMLTSVCYDTREPVSGFLQVSCPSSGIGRLSHSMANIDVHLLSRTSEDEPTRTMSARIGENRGTVPIVASGSENSMCENFAHILSRPIASFKPHPPISRQQPLTKARRCYKHYTLRVVGAHDQPIWLAGGYLCRESRAVLN